MFHVIAAVWLIFGFVVWATGGQWNHTLLCVIASLLCFTNGRIEEVIKKLNERPPPKN